MRPALLGAGLVLSVLAGVGCEKIIGADFGGVQTVTCAHVQPPGPPPVHGVQGDAEFVFAITAPEMGDTNDPSGTPGYKSIGYDLDGVCTNESQGPSCQSFDWAAPDPTDGVDGRDNGIGQLMFGEAAQFGGSAPLSSQTLKDGIKSGSIAPLAIVRVQKYELGTDDDQVDVDWYTPLTLGEARAPDDGGVIAPAWDGSDVWPLRSDSIVGGGADAGTTYPNAAFRDPSAYVSSYTIVSHLQNGAILRLQNVPFALDQIVLVANVSITPGSPPHVTGGTITARLRLSELFTKLPEMTVQFGLGALCRDSPTYPVIRKYFCKYSEILADGGVDPGAPCDAISVGFQFQALAVKLGPAIVVTSKASCPPETNPAGDTCTQP